MVDAHAAVLLPCQSRAARGLLNWTQEELAQASGVSRSTVREFESGHHALHRATERAMIAALEAAGVRLLPAGDHGPGVMLRSGGGCGR